FFFFQAEDGIRDFHVTGVQTCALPISLWIGAVNVNKGTIQIGQIMAFLNYLLQILMSLMMIGMIFIHITRAFPSMERAMEILDRSEERRVGKEGRSGWEANVEQKE